jgi:hypothetical protein
MLINLAIACRMNSTCSDHKGGGEEQEEKKGRRMLALVEKESF